MCRIEQRHYVIAGFRQGRGSNHGIRRLWRSLHNALAAPQRTITFHNWRDDWAAVAEDCRRTADEDGITPAIFLYAYSWGAGWGALGRGWRSRGLCYELARRGLPVVHLVASDPVYRSPLLSTRWLALLSGMTIHVPANVREVTYYVQRINRPRGHRLVADDPHNTTIHKPTNVGLRHRWMDDLQIFHDRALQVATGRHPLLIWRPKK